MTSKISETAHALMSARAVRAKADEMFARAEADELPWWRLNVEALPACADYVAAIIRARYPDLNVPFHARWRHFVFGGRDLWSERAATARWKDEHDRARAEFDLAIVSVLLDAGAGPDWKYRDEATGIVAGRSEGLALASLRLFELGALSRDPSDPLRAHAHAMVALTTPVLSDVFGASPENPLAGLKGRAKLLNRFGRHMVENPHLFSTGELPRPGGIYDVLRKRAADSTLPAAAILDVVLEAITPIWSGRPDLDGIPLGDCWPVKDLGYVPLHKLSQWLAYSLIEPLERAGVRVTDIDGLTGLAEYRNGGLFIDLDVLAPRKAGDAAKQHDVDDAFVVTWRSLTVALLDRIAPLVRERLGVSAEQFPLARVLEGGTWAAGRAIAREKRADGGPPLFIHSDGTVF